MPQDPLLTQLASRCRTFSAGTNISLHKIARLVGMEPSNFSNFINGHCGLSARTTIKLLQLLNSSQHEIEMKLGQESGKQVRIEHYQANGKPMTLDNSGSWVSGDPNCTDPNDSTDITGTSTARDLDGSDDYLQQISAFLKDQQNVYRSAIAEIDKYLAGIQRAKPNKDGVTEPPRKVNSNGDSRKPGARGNAYRTPEVLRGAIERMRSSRKAEEEKLQLEKELSAEAKAWLNAKQEVGRVQ